MQAEDVYGDHGVVGVVILHHYTLFSRVRLVRMINDLLLGERQAFDACFGDLTHPPEGTFATRVTLVSWNGSRR